jgi:hypothetical protein
MVGQVFKLGTFKSIAAQLAPVGASIVWFEDIGFKDRAPFDWTDVEFSKRAFSAIAAGEGLPVLKTLEITGSEIYDVLRDRGVNPDDMCIAGNAFMKRYLFIYA